jgi:hypothetical protein
MAHGVQSRWQGQKEQIVKFLLRLWAVLELVLLFMLLPLALLTWFTLKVADLLVKLYEDESS